jgi:polar amino acid transport system substrate-binding protein
MKRIALAFIAGVAAIGMAQAQDLPDLGGRTIVAVTENAYTPLNFADPATGEGIGWEYDAFNEIARRLNATVDWQLASWDTMIEAVLLSKFYICID